MTLTATCHCGSLRLEVDTPPESVTSCNCSICRRYGVLWAYYHPSAVRLVPADASTDSYACHQKTQLFHRCPTCGCVTHWASDDPNEDTTGVNARLFEPDVLAAARPRHLDGADTWEYLDEEPRDAPT